jgi:hypothetical protein
MIRNISVCHLPRLQTLLVFATNTLPMNGLTIHEAFPHLRELSLSDDMTEPALSDRMLSDLANLKFLKLLAFPTPSVVSSDGIVSAHTILTFARARSACGSRTTAVSVKVPWCHDVLFGHAELLLANITIQLSETAHPKCVCPLADDAHKVCQYQLHPQPPSEKVNAV